MGCKQRVTNLLSLLLISFFHLGCKKEFFNWNLVAAPSISDVTLIENNLNNFVVSANCTSDGNDTKTVNGFCWSTNDFPTIQDSNIKISNGVGNFQSSLNWTSNSTIYIRAFSQNGVTIKYSNSRKTTWTGTSNIHPELSTLNPTITGFNSVDLAGAITNTAGLEIQEVGFCISQSSNPTILNSTKIILPQNNSSNYQSTLSNLNDGSTYYITIYTKTIVGYTYGNIINITLPRKYSIGSIGPGQGIVFYQNPVFSTEWNFLEIYTNSIGGGGFVWAPFSIQTNLTDINLSAGFNNSNDIITKFGFNSVEYAAHKAKINFNNKNDWYLPSLLELKLGLTQLKLSQSFSNINIGGVYWSSSEDSNFPNNAWVIKVNNNDFQSNTVDKSFLNLVQPIRRF